VSERARTGRVVAQQSSQAVRAGATPLRVVGVSQGSQQQRFWVTARGD
jgi:hypothetical protein